MDTVIEAVVKFHSINVPPVVVPVAVIMAVPLQTDACYSSVGIGFTVTVPFPCADGQPSQSAVYLRIRLMEIQL
jgi:hypothetical protein